MPLPGPKSDPKAGYFLAPNGVLLGSERGALWEPKREHFGTRNGTRSALVSQSGTLGTKNVKGNPLSVLN